MDLVRIFPGEDANDVLTLQLWVLGFVVMKLLYYPPP